MGKTNKSFRKDDFDDEDENGYRMHSEKHQRYAERLIENALKAKNVEAFVAEEDLEFVDDDLLEIQHDMLEENYVACIECGKVLITEEDFVGASHYYQPLCDLHGENSPEISEWSCAACMKNDQDN